MGRYNTFSCICNRKYHYVNKGDVIAEIYGEKTGFICTPFDSDDLKNSIEKVCSLSNAEYKAMSNRAVEKAKIEFSPTTYAQKLTEKYNELINNHKKKD